MDLPTPPRLEPSDEEAVAASLRDREQFRVLVQRYQAPLLRYVSRLGADPEAAKDVVQESFIKAYTNLHDFETSRSFSAWIYRIAHNQAMDHFRRQRNRPQLRELPDDTRSLETIADELDIERELDARLEAERIGAALKQVSPRYVEVLMLRFFEEKSYDEIADILHMPPGTVSTYLTRGKAELRALLLAYSNNDPVL